MQDTLKITNCMLIVTCNYFDGIVMSVCVAVRSASLKAGCAYSWHRFLKAQIGRHSNSKNSYMSA